MTPAVKRQTGFTVLTNLLMGPPFLAMKSSSSDWNWMSGFLRVAKMLGGNCIKLRQISGTNIAMSKSKAL